jgi:hypothetical protein
MLQEEKSPAVEWCPERGKQRLDAKESSWVRRRQARSARRGRDPGHGSLPSGPDRRRRIAAAGAAGLETDPTAAGTRIARHAAADRPMRNAGFQTVPVACRGIRSGEVGSHTDPVSVNPATVPSVRRHRQLSHRCCLRRSMRPFTRDASGLRRPESITRPPLFQLLVIRPCRSGNGTSAAAGYERRARCRDDEIFRLDSRLPPTAYRVH